MALAILKRPLKEGRFCFFIAIATYSMRVTGHASPALVYAYDKGSRADNAIMQLKKLI
jgi:hypothetical protein